MKILFLSHGFPPIQHSGVFRSAAFARYLPNHQITPLVISGAPKTESRVPDYTTESSTTEKESYPPPTRLDWKLDITPSTTMRYGLRIPGLNTLCRRRLTQRVANQVLDVAGRIIEQENPSVILSTSPPVEAHLIAEQLSQKYCIPFVCDLRDPWTYFPWVKYRSWLDFVLERRQERYVLTRAARVIANTEMAKRLLEKKVQVAKNRITVIPNGYEESEFEDTMMSKPLIPGKFLMTYTGLLSSPRSQSTATKSLLKRMLGLDYIPLDIDFTTRSPIYILKAAEHLLRARPEFKAVLRMLFVGNFSQSDRKSFESFAFTECLEIRPPVESFEANRICCQSQLLLLLQIRMHLNGRDVCPCVPGKLYNYLRSGTRILAPTDNKEIAKLIKATDCGTVVDPTDSTAIATVLERELDAWNSDQCKMKERAETIAKFERRALTLQLADALRSVHGAADASIGFPELDRCR